MLDDAGESWKRDCDVFNIETPDGTANIIIAHSQPGQIEKIFFSIGHAGTSVNAWAFALAEAVTSCIKKGSSINDMIQLLSNITSSRPVMNNKGVVCRSGPEALYLALMRYRNSIDHTKGKVEYSEDYTPGNIRPMRR